MYVRNLAGDEYAVQATVTNDNEVNGNQSLTGDIEYNKVNALFLSGLDTLWEIYDHDDVGYKIINLNKKGNGNKLQVSFTAIPLFFDYMDTHSMMDDDGNHYRYDGSMTAFNAFNKVFADTPFTFVIVDQLTAVEWENFGGGESRLETFKRCLERYECEFRIVGSTVYLENQIGRDTSIQYRHKLNASNITQEIDASAYYTAIRGYGHFGEGTSEDSTEEDYRNARLIRDYVSPLAKILGKRYSPPFMDGRVKVKAEMDRKLKKEVDESLKVSVSSDIVNLSSQGYPIDNSQAGDRVFLIDERIGFDEEVRIVSQSITRDWTGKVIDASVTFGNEGLGKRHQSQLNTAVKNITDIFEGRKQLPLSHLDKRVQEISNIINGNTDSIFKYTPNGIIGWNGDNPNYMTRYVGDAIGFSKDGGNTYGTAMSAELGIVADYITTGTLRAIIVDGVEIYGSRIEGSTLISQLNDEYTKIENSFLESKGSHRRIWKETDEINTVKIKIENGQVRARNDDRDWSLYFNDYGLSTFSDGTGDNFDGSASGVIEFHSPSYSPASGALGLTISSGARIGIESNGRIYLNPQGASVRISDINDNYAGIAASAFTQSSSLNQKRDIQPLQDDALSVVNALNIKEYKRLTNGEVTILDKWQAGIIVEEAPSQFLADGDSIDMYTYVNYLARSIQQLSDKIEVLEST